MKKVFGTIGLGAMALGVLLGAGSPIEQVSANGVDGQTIAQTAKEFHQGEKPLKVYKSEATGVEVEVYASNPEDAEKIKKEKGWTDNEPVKIMKDKDKAKKSEKKQPSTKLLTQPLQVLLTTLERSKLQQTQTRVVGIK
ncbi:hypothetical protein J7I93_06260 [Bacillus sp. ISL-47]|uniref:hypothetical protein n=1 Tax=Bacillus sp. ISL-47 TaxID=2819130 RepID=UPI001BEA905A|nr:hypothetical protein [Bacillus sp. ISL-47]MBT2687775.1 hypothetical protein [Bacillus sp. ISL-47]MBT2709127.1 hypothetical protein [Pseudomonas sp. ISL-84]